MRAETAVNARRKQRRVWDRASRERERERPFSLQDRESEREKRRIPRLSSIRAISRVTNLYGIVWFIGRKFNNGRPNNPQEKEDERNHCQEKKIHERREDGKIYDAYVWISASRAKSLSTIFQRDIRCTNRQFMIRAYAHSRILVG